MKISKCCVTGRFREAFDRNAVFFNWYMKFQFFVMTKISRCNIDGCETEK